MPRSTNSTVVPSRLLDVWQQREEYGKPIGCLTSSYTFDSEFFEQDCIARFLGISSDPVSEEWEYLLEREEKLSDAYAAAVVDQHHAVRHGSMRWDLLSVRVPNAIQHSKVTVLAWENLVRVLVTSANLTKPGYRENLEFAGVLDFARDGALPISVLSDVLDFLGGLRALTVGTDQKSEGPQERYRRFLKRVRAHCRSWGPATWRPGKEKVHFAGLLPGTDSLLDRLKADVWRGAGPDTCQITSPFFDAGDGILDLLGRVRGLMGTQGYREIQIVAPGGKNRDRSYWIALPSAVVQFGGERDDVSYFVRPDIVDNERRSFHGKGIWFERGDRAVHCIGSSNFTHAGFGESSHPNVEANLVYEIPHVDSEFAAACGALDGESEEVDPELDTVHFLEPSLTASADGDAFAPLPIEFGAAIFEVRDGEPSLSLDIMTTFGEQFTIVASEDVPEVYSSSLWLVAGKPQPIRVTWGSDKPPTTLMVTIGSGAEVRVCAWPVNPASFDALPLPEALRSLTVDQILAVLTSSRPAHRVIKASRTERKERAAGEDVIDPHRRVDTHNFILRRVARFSRALRGLSESLEKVTYSDEGFKRKLFGVFGPVSLADALIKEELEVTSLTVLPDLGGGAAFMLAEIVRTVKAADYRAVEKVIGRTFVRSQVTDAVDRLYQRASDLKTPANLRSYVNRVFSEVTA